MVTELSQAQMHAVNIVLRSGRDLAPAEPLPANLRVLLPAPERVLIAPNGAIPAFCGRPDESLDDWIDLATRALIAGGLNADAAQAKAAAALESALRDAAADAVAVAPDNGRDTPAHLFDTLRASFGSAQGPAAHRANLAAYRRTTESINEFVAKVRRLAHRVDPTTPEPALIAHCMAALDAPTRSMILLQPSADTLAAFLITARSAELALATMRLDQSTPPRPRYPASRPSRPLPLPPPTCHPTASTASNAPSSPSPPPRPRLTPATSSRPVGLLWTPRRP